MGLLRLTHPTRLIGVSLAKTGNMMKINGKKGLTRLLSMTFIALRRINVGVVPILMVLFLSVPQIQAATFNVNSTTDAVDATPGNGVCATAGAVCTLRAAIQEANALAGTDTINIPAGTYTLTIAGTYEDVAATGDLDITGALTITGSGQGATIIDGGAIDRVFDMFAGAVTVNISDLTVRNGQPGALAGGIYNSSAVTLTLTRVTVTSNVSTGQGGGINSPGTLILNDVDITNNTAGSSGGGIYNQGTITYNRGTISGNTSPSEGGGIYNSGTATLTNVTVSGNTATSKGSGILIVGGDTLYLNNVTVYGNLTSKGIEKGTGGAAITSFKNTIIAGHAAGNCSLAFTSGGYNLESTTNTCGFTGGTDQNSVTAGNLNIGALASNGGPTQTHALLAGSFAIDKIPNGTNDCGTTITTDQRGIARPQNGTCDVGAYESPPPNCPGNVVTTTADSGNNSLRECINTANASPGTTISFNIPGPGNQSSGGDSWWRISPASALPTITANGTIMDGTTQTTNQGNTNTLGPEIEIDGSGAGVVHGLDMSASNSTIKGLIINGFNVDPKAGVNIWGSNNTVSGNYIGTNYKGTTTPAVTPNKRGVQIATAGQNNVIGGTTASDRNIISGNSSFGVVLQNVNTKFNVIKGNYIGVAPDGVTAVSNTWGGILLEQSAAQNTIGGTTANDRNIISGSASGYGIAISGEDCDGNIIKGNYIGTDYTGTVDVGNATYGIFVEMADSTVIGGTTSNERNIISGNNSYGVLLYANSNNNTVYGNYIGTQADGISALGNGSVGIYIPGSASGTATGNIIGGTAAGQGNVIAYNINAGIYVDEVTNSADNNKISGNSIFSNTGLGIDLGPLGIGATNGANNNKARPTITAITPSGADFTISATVTSGDTIEFFRVNNTASPAVSADGSGSGEGYLYLGSCVDNGACSGPHISAVADANAAVGTVQATLLSSGLSNGDYVTATATDGANGTSEFSINMLAGFTISGTVYTDEGTTNIGSGKTIRLIKNGVDAGNAVTNASGQYSISTASLIAGDAMLVYVDGDAKKGTTVTVSNGANLAGLNIYSGNSDGTGDGYVIVRHDNGGSMTSALMSTALGAYSDTDIKYTVPAGVLTVSTYNYLYVPAGHTFAPGANTNLDSAKILSTFTGGTYTHTVAAHWNASGGTYTEGTSTLSFLVRASGFSFSPGASTYYNVVVDANEKSFSLGGNLTVSNDMTFKTTGAGFGTFSVGAWTVAAKNFIWPSGYLAHAAGAIIQVSADLTKTGGGYFAGNGAGLTFRFVGSGNSTFNPGSGTHGSIAVSKDNQTAAATLSTNNLVMAGSQSLNINTGIFDIAGRNLNIGASSTFSNTGTMRLQGGETITNLTNDIDSGTVEYNGGGAYGSLAVGNTYYHLTFNGAGSWVNTGALDVNGNLTITSGTLNSSGQNVTVAGNWSNSGTYTSGANTVTLDGTNQQISGTTTFNNLAKAVATADTLTFAAGSTTIVNGTATLNGASGQLLSLRSSTPGTRWNLNLAASAVKVISYVDVKDSDASGSDASKKPISPTNSTDSSNNIEWFAYIGVDGSFAEWCDASGTDFCVDDEGGNDDWTNPARLDITRFGVASNRADTFYVLFGYDDTALAQESTACVLVDTDADNYINKAICTVINNNPTTVSSAELYNCDDSIAGGCGGAALSKSYGASDYGISNTSSGPWNTDTLIELKVPYTDLGIPNGTIILNTLISYPGSGFLKSPKDSIFGATSQDYEKRIQYDTDDGTGVLIAGPGNQSVSGIVYSDEGTTSIGSGKTIRLIKNGVSVGTDTTDAAGGYFISGAIADGNGIIAYIDGNDGSTDDGTTVTVFKGPNLTTLNIYKDHLITRHDNAGVLGNANMSAALGAYSDTEILYSVSGSDLIVSGTDTELHVPTGHTFTPGGNVSTMDAKVLGTLNGGTYTFTVAGNWNSTGGTVAYGSSTLNMTGVAKTFQTKDAERPWNLTIGDGVSATSVSHSPPNWQNMVNNNLVLANNATLTVSGMYYYMPVTGGITIGAGATLNISGGVMTRHINDSSSHISTTGTISGTGTFEVVIEAGSTNAPVTARTYGVDLSVSGEVNAVGVLGGGASLNLGAKNLLLYDVNSNNDFYGILDNPANIPVTAADLYLANPSGSGNAPFFSGKLICRGATYTFTNVTVYSSNTAVTSIDCLTGGASSTWNVSGNVTIDGSRTYTGLISAGASIWNVGGNWSNTGTFTAGTSTVTLNGANQAISGSTIFYNLTKSVDTARTLTFAASSTTTVNGTATLNGASGQLLSLASSTPGTRWNFVLPASSTKVVSYVSVQDSDASGSDASKKAISPSNSTDAGNNIDWFVYPIIKQMWEENGTAPLTSPSSIAKGATFVFLIYVKNTSSSVMNDVRINDNLDETAFQYIDGSLFRTSAATPPADTATDKQIFDSTASGTGTNLTEAVDGDVGSSADTGGGADKDRITVGAVTGQTNAALNIPANTAFAIRFKVKVK